MLEVMSIRVSFGDVVALSGASLTVPAGSTTAVMGPSGCGKSTLLRVIAGLESPGAGRVTWRGRDLDGVPTHERGFGLMFQDYALFPHRSVGGNVAFGLRMAGWERDAIAERVEGVLSLVGLNGYADRRIAGLSGGEQQRVALARALAPAPELLMLDEPIGALDRDLRDQLMTDMRGLFAELDVTVLYVTHDQDEAFALADHVAVMQAGRILGSGAAEDLWRNPGSAFTARFIGHDNVVDGSAARRLAAVGILPSKAPVSIAAGAITATPLAAGPGQVVASRFVSGTYRTTIDVNGVTLTTDCDAVLPTGSAVGIEIDSSGVTHLDNEG
jgi:thiamine transport system ATP-binding protein